MASYTSLLARRKKNSVNNLHQALSSVQEDAQKNPYGDKELVLMKTLGKTTVNLAERMERMERRVRAHALAPALPPSCVVASLPHGPRRAPATRLVALSEHVITRARAETRVHSARELLATNRVSPSPPARL